MSAALYQYPVPILWFTTVGQTVADIRATQINTSLPVLNATYWAAWSVLDHLADTTDGKIDGVRDRVGDVSSFQTEVLAGGIADVRDRVAGVHSYVEWTVFPWLIDVRDRVGDVSSFQTEVLAGGIAQVLEDVRASHQLLVTGVLPMINQVLGVVTPAHQLLVEQVVPGIAQVSGAIQSVHQLLVQEVVPARAEILAVVIPTLQVLVGIVVPGIAQVWGGVQSTQQLLVETVVPAAEEILGVVIPTRQVLEGNVVPGIAQVVSGVQSTYQLLVQEVVPTTEEILGVVIPTRQVLEGTVVPGIAQVMGGVESTQQVIDVTVVPGIAQVLGVVQPTQQVLVETVVPQIAQILNVVTPAHQVLVGIVVPGIAQVWQGIVTLNSGLHELVTMLPPLMPGPTAPPIAALGQLLLQAFDDSWPRKPKTVGDTAENAVQSLKDRILGWFEDFKALPGQYLNFVADRAGTDLAMDPSRAFDTIGELYALSIGAGTAAHLVSTALNAIPTLNWVGASQLSAFIAEAAGFKPITDASYGVLLNQCIAWPLQYYWNEKLRPKIPTEGAIYAMGRKRGLNRDQFGEAMAYHGLPEWWIDKEYAFFWTDPSPYWLLRMSEHATPALEPSPTFLPWLDEWLPNWRNDPWAWFKMKLMLAGFEDTDIPAFIDGFQRRRLGPAVTQVKTSVRAMVREGYWGRTEAEAALRPMGVREEEIEYLILAEEIDYQNRFLDGQVLYYNESFRKGEISRQDLSLVLSTIIVKPERVAQIVSREVVRALPKPKAVVPVREDPRVKSLVTQAVNSWTKGYRAWELEEEELEVGFTIVLQDPALAQQMVIVERTRYRPPPPPPPPVEVHPLVASALRAAVASWIARYRAWDIDARDLEEALIRVLEDVPLAREIVATEEERYRPPPKPPVVPVEDPLVRKSRVAAIASHVSDFREGKITAAILELQLSNLIVDPDIVVLIRQIEELRAVPAPDILPPWEEEPLVAAVREETVRGHIEMFRKRLIDIEELYAYLVADGLAESLARSTALTQALKRIKTPPLESPYFQADRLRELIDEAIASYTRMLELGQITMEEFEAYLAGAGVDPDVITYLGDTQEVRQFILLEGMA